MKRTLSRRKSEHRQQQQNPGRRPPLSVLSTIIKGGSDTRCREKGSASVLDDDYDEDEDEEGHDGSNSATHVSSLSSLFLQRPSSSTGRTSGGGRMSSGPFSSSSSIAPEVEILRSSIEVERDSKLMAINRLRFETLGLIGRQDEIAILNGCFQRVRRRNERKYDRLAVATNVRSTKTAEGTETSKEDTIQAWRQCEVVFVSGESGTGKSALAASLRGAVRHAKGVWVEGKYDLKLRDQQPLAGIGAICNELCRVVLNERGPVQVSEIRQQLEDRIDRPLLQLIENIIPLLGFILASEDVDARIRTIVSEEFSASEGGQSTTPRARRASINEKRRPIGLRRRMARRASRTRVDDSSKAHSTFSPGEVMRIEPSHSRHLIQFALRTFFRIFASTLGPIVAVLDDLQWADNSSLEILKAVARDPLISNLMIVGCYRPDIVKDEHILSKAIEDLKLNAGTDEYCVTEVAIGNLSKESVKELVMDLLSVPEEKALGLSDICYKRTLGNVFFVKVFLTMLHEANILEFQIGTFQWTWDDNKVETETAATANVVDVIKAKMDKYPDGMMLLLKVASCLGNTFERDTVELLWTTLAQKQQSAWMGSLEKLLKVAVRDMLLEPVGEDAYRFVHDKIQEMALLLIPEDEFAEFRGSIGKSLYLNMGEEDNKMLFVMADLLNNGLNSGFEIAELNAKAAERAKDLSAFISAVRYVEYGIMCLNGTDMWNKHHHLALKLYSIGAEAEECIGNTEKSIWYCKEVRAQKGIKALDKMRANKVVVERLYSDGKYEELWQCCLDILDELGCRLPRKRSVQRISAKLLLAKTKRYGFPTPKDVVDMPEMEDRTKREELEFMIKVASFCLGSKNKPLYVLLCCKCVRLTTRYGLTAHTPSALASFANVLMHEDGDWDSALKAADLALAIDKRFVSNYTKTSTLHKLNSFVLGWVRPLRTCRTGYLDAYRLGMLSGNIEGVGMAILFLLMSQFFSGGTPLQSIDQDLRQYIPQLERLKLHSFVLGLRLLWQKVLNLMDVSYNPHTTELAGTAMHGIDLDRHPFIFNTVGRHHLCNLCLYFAEYDRGAEIALAMGDVFYQTWSGASYFGFEPFSRAICLYAAARNRRPGPTNGYLGAARKVRATIGRWVKAGAINLAHQWSILDAEEAAIRGNPRSVKKKYETAIVASGRGGFLQDAGIANERLALYLLDQAGMGVVGDSSQGLGKGVTPAIPNSELLAEASHHMSQAIRYFASWGAHRKVKLLKEKYGPVLTLEDDLDGLIQR